MLHVNYWMVSYRTLWENMAALHGQLGAAAWSPVYGWHQIRIRGWAPVHPLIAASCWRGLRRLADDLWWSVPMGNDTPRNISDRQTFNET